MENQKKIEIKYERDCLLNCVKAIEEELNKFLPKDIILKRIELIIKTTKKNL